VAQLFLQLSLPGNHHCDLNQALEFQAAFTTPSTRASTSHVFETTAVKNNEFYAPLPLARCATV
jgi:hypothetical protein